MDLYTICVRKILYKMVIIFSPKVYIEFYSEGLWFKKKLVVLKTNIGYFLSLFPMILMFSEIYSSP